MATVELRTPGGERIDASSLLRTYEHFDGRQGDPQATGIALGITEAIEHLFGQAEHDTFLAVALDAALHRQEVQGEEADGE